MHVDFWHQKWQKNEIGFHLPEVNPLLVKYFHILKLTQGASVFLPLCGKTLDIAWLMTQGYRVVGAELSVVAIEGLFKHLGLTPTIKPVGELVHYSAPNIDIYVGDIFKLTNEILGHVDAVYDRAALVALPADMRQDYSAHLTALTQAATQLLICFEYDQALQAGPPFSVGAEEVRQHYQTAYQLNLIASIPVAGGLKGKSPAAERVWHLAPLNLD